MCRLIDQLIVVLYSFLRRQVFPAASAFCFERWKLAVDMSKRKVSLFELLLQ